MTLLLWKLEDSLQLLPIMLVALYQEKGGTVQPAMQAETTEQTEKTTVEVLFYFEHG